jgi:hypothetical protein
MLFFLFLPCCALSTLSTTINLSLFCLSKLTSEQHLAPGRPKRDHY